MIEVLYDAIKAVAGQDIDLTVDITEMDIDITTGCALMIQSDTEDIAMVEGRYNEELEMWQFTVPAEATKGLHGRYWYCVQQDNENLCFKKPLYLIG